MPFAIFRSAVLRSCSTPCPILGILLVLPTSQVTNFGGFVDAIQQVFTVYGGSVGKGTVTLTGAGAVLGELRGDHVHHLRADLGRDLDHGLGPGAGRVRLRRRRAALLRRDLGAFGTPVRVNIFSGILSTAVLVGAHQITGGSAEKLFSTVLGLAISTTLISYIGIFPALAVLRRKLPNVERPYRAPAATFTSVWLTILIVFSVIQLFFPGLGSHWFGDAFRPSAWKADEKWKYLLTDLVPLAVFVAAGVAFWASGRSTRERLADPAAVRESMHR